MKFWLENLLQNDLFKIIVYCCYFFFVAVLTSWQVQLKHLDGRIEEVKDLHLF